MADENPQENSPESNIPKKETVRITLPTRPQNDPQGVKRETLNLDGDEAARNTMRIDSGKTDARTTGQIKKPGEEPKKESTQIRANVPPVPTKPTAANNPPLPGSIKPPSPIAPKPPVPLAPKPPGAGAPKPPMPAAPKVPAAPQYQGNKPVGAQPVSKQTSRIKVPQGAKPLPQATVRMQPSQPPVSAPMPTIRTTDITNDTAATDSAGMILSWIVAIIALAAAVCTYLAFSA